MLSRYPFKELEQLHPLADSLLIFKVDGLVLIQPIPVGNIDPESLVLVKTPLDLEPIKTDDHNGVFCILLLANDDG